MTTSQESQMNDAIEENERLTQVTIAALQAIPEKKALLDSLCDDAEPVERPSDTDLADAVAAKFNVPYHVAFEWLGNFGDGAV